eukprot:2033869-Amphidinium_carterae.1
MEIPPLSTSIAQPMKAPERSDYFEEQQKRAFEASQGHSWGIPHPDARNTGKHGSFGDKPESIK